MRSGGRLADFLSRLAILVIVLIGIVGVFGWYLPLIKENQSLRKELAVQEELITHSKERIQAKQKRLYSYKHDPRSAERLARENLIYSKEGETVFRFESPKANPRAPQRDIRGQ